MTPYVKAVAEKSPETRRASRRCRREALSAPRGALLAGECGRTGSHRDRCQSVVPLTTSFLSSWSLSSCCLSGDPSSSWPSSSFPSNLSSFYVLPCESSFSIRPPSLSQSRQAVEHEALEDVQLRKSILSRRRASQHKRARKRTGCHRSVRTSVDPCASDGRRRRAFDGVEVIPRTPTPHHRSREAASAIPSRGAASRRTRSPSSIASLSRFTHAYSARSVS
jgi:hypothetical protein